MIFGVMTAKGKREAMTPYGEKNKAVFPSAPGAGG
jgi:hypothetical protein